MKPSLLLSYLVFISGSTLAATVKRPRACVTDANQLLITGQYCGAGETATFTGDATAVVNEQCFTKSGNPVQGVPKKKTEPVSIGPTTINPPDTGCVPICILSDEVSPTLQCTGTQEAQIVGSVIFVDVTITGSNLPKPITFSRVANSCTENELACLT